jgi:hypothetical protein
VSTLRGFVGCDVQTGRLATRGVLALLACSLVACAATEDMVVGSPVASTQDDASTQDGASSHNDGMTFALDAAVHADGNPCSMVPWSCAGSGDAAIAGDANDDVDAK